MTVKIDIDKYTANSQFINRMLHMADQSKLGETENGNGMLDTEKEVSKFLQLAENNKEKLAKLGYEIQGQSSLFTVTKTNSKYDSEKYKSMLTYDLKHDFIEEKICVDGFISSRTTFNSNNDIKATINDAVTDEVISCVDENGYVHYSFVLTFVDLLTLGCISRRLKAMDKLTNVWNYDSK